MNDFKNILVNTRMKIYIVSKEPFPYGMAATNRIICYAKALKEANLPCEVLIFTRTEKAGTGIKNAFAGGVFEGITFKYIGGKSIRNKHVFIRKLLDLLDQQKLIRYLKNNLKKGDVVFGYCGTHVNFINKVIDTAHKKDAIYIRELCELPYGTSQETPKSIKLRKVLLKQFPKCDGFIAISDSLVELAQKYKSPKAQILKIPILVDYDKYAISDISNKAEIPYIFHSGTLYEQKDGILGMIEAFGIASQQLSFPIHFILTGDKKESPHATVIDELIIKYQLQDKIHFVGYLNEEKLREYLSLAALVIINKYDTQQNKYCFSTKLAEYLAAGKPTIITDVGEAQKWLTNEESAIIVKNGDIKILAEKITILFSDEKFRKKLSSQGKKVCEQHFNYKHYGIILKNYIESIYQTYKDEKK